MYTDFYKLKEKPFNLTPSSRFLYLGEGHKEALALLTYGVLEKKGFILLTGEVGTGKTTMVRALLNNLDDSVLCIYLSNPILTPKDFLNYLAVAALNQQAHFKGKTDFLVSFEAFLKDCLQHQKNFVLIIDEAQKLSFELLEEIRLLSNMETGDEKLINIFLVGQPELNAKLSEKRCRPLLQRISVRYHIPPLDLENTRNYMATRLKVAGASNPESIFSRAAVKSIHHFADGYPRMINILADNALLLGYSRGIKKIGPSIVKECYEDMTLDGSYSRERIPGETTQGEEKPVYHPGGRFRRWAFFLLLVLAVVALALSRQGSEMLSEVINLVPSITTETGRNIGIDPIVKKSIDRSEQAAIPGEQQETGQIPVDNNSGTKQNISLPSSGPIAQDEPLEEEDRSEWKKITVKRGDTLTELTASVYGSANDDILDTVRRSNPGIRNVNLIEVGQEINFPPLGREVSIPTFTVRVGSYRTFESARNKFMRLSKEGYDVYIMPANDHKYGRVFWVTLGSFESHDKAEVYAGKILEQGLVDYARPVQTEVR